MAKVQVCPKCGGPIEKDKDGNAVCSYCGSVVSFEDEKSPLDYYIAKRKSYNTERNSDFDENYHYTPTNKNKKIIKRCIVAVLFLAIVIIVTVLILR